MSAWHYSTMPLCVSRITNHGTDMDTMSNMLGTRLVKIVTMTIPPHHVAVIPIAPSSHFICSTNITTELIEVIKSPLLYIEQPCLCILDTLHKFYDRGQNKCIALAANISDEELRIPQNSLFMFHKDFYPKPRIRLLDSEL